MSTASFVFSADSPYLNEQISDSLEAQLQSQSDFRAIKQKMHEWIATSKQLAETSEDLSRLLSGTSSTGATIPSSDALECLSVVMGELGQHQDALSDSLQQTFLNRLDIFFESKEMQEILNLREQYNISKTNHVAVLNRYLQSDLLPPPSKSSHSSKLSSAEDYRAFDVVTNFKRQEIDRFDLISRINFYEQRKGLDVLEACVAASAGLQIYSASVGSLTSDSVVSHMKELSTRVAEIKSTFLADQLAMGRQRRDLESVVESMIERVQYQLPQLPQSNSSNLSGPGDQHLAETATLRESSSVASPFQPSLSATTSGGLRSLLSTFGSRAYEATSSAAAAAAAAAATAAALQTGRESISSGVPDSSIVRVPLSETELKMKALELPQEFDAIYSPIERFTFFSQNVRRQGYVFYLKGKIGKVAQAQAQGWRREWMVLDDTKLYLVREGFEMELLVNLEVCSVRDRTQEGYSWCVEIANANKSTVSLLFEGNTSFRDWLAAIRSSIEDRLGSTHLAAFAAPSRPTPSSSCSNLVDADNAVPPIHTASTQPLIDAIMASSTCCSDCKAEASTTPLSWVSLNNATLVCIECSGIHRNLGSHISKVRSLKMDNLLEAELNFLLSAKEINAKVWESLSGEDSSLWAGVSPRPRSASERDTLIRAKYCSKRFMQRVQGDVDSVLRSAVESDNMPLAMLCIAQGGGWKEKGSLLRLACESGSINCVVLLVLNSSDGDNLDPRLSVGSAADLGHTLITQFLRAKYSSVL